MTAPLTAPRPWCGPRRRRRGLRPRRQRTAIQLVRSGLEPEGWADPCRRQRLRGHVRVCGQRDRPCGRRRVRGEVPGQLSCPDHAGRRTEVGDRADLATLTIIKSVSCHLERNLMEDQLTHEQATTGANGGRMELRFLGNSGLKVSAISLGNWVTHTGGRAEQATACVTSRRRWRTRWRRSPMSRGLGRRSTSGSANGRPSSCGLARAGSEMKISFPLQPVEVQRPLPRHRTGGRAHPPGWVSASSASPRLSRTSSPASTSRAIQSHKILAPQTLMARNSSRPVDRSGRAEDLIQDWPQ